MSSCQNVSDTGLSLLTSGIGCLRQLTLAYGSPVPLTLPGVTELHVLASKPFGNYCALLRELSLSKCSGVTDEGLSSLVKKQKDIRKLDITCCRKMESCTLVPREAFVLIGRRCHQLEELDLTDNEIDDEVYLQMLKAINSEAWNMLELTDEGAELYWQSAVRNLWNWTCIGITAIARGCPDLEMLNISYCQSITDASLISVSKCAKLNTLECRGCPLITSLGIAAIAVGCKHLTMLDIKKCYNINDFGINMSCTSITDVGLLSLASISCLQSIIILHLKGLSPRGLAAALLACGGLTKVKLHSSFKTLLPRPLFEHLEARGCVFQWREKIQDELETPNLGNCK
ncbi:F-box/LRR-repeat protein 3 [Bienertia sinuspersici]